MRSIRSLAAGSVVVLFSVVVSYVPTEAVVGPGPCSGMWGSIWYEPPDPPAASHGFLNDGEGPGPGWGEPFYVGMRNDSHVQWYLGTGDHHTACGT